MPNGNKKDQNHEQYAHLRLKAKSQKEQKKGIDFVAAYEVLLSAYEREHLREEST